MTSDRANAYLHARVRVELPMAPYDVVVGRGLAGAFGDFLRSLEERTEKVFIVTQASLQDRAAAFVSSSGIANAHTLLIDEGEGAKSLAAVRRLYDELADGEAHRHDAVVAFGGGVVTDVAGFVASTFNRGMVLVNVPSTLLGQVDAAIGGKTGINLERGKNLVGTIYQPAAVFCDVALLETVPPEEISSGLAEVVKYGFIADPSLLDTVESHADALIGRDLDLLADVVVRCATIKARVVAEDERDSGIRALLNYGHTFAHAIERVQGYGDVRHGEAVSLGMMAAAFLASEMGLIDTSVVQRHRSVLATAGLPVAAPLDVDELEVAWRHDKKYRGGVRFVLLEKTDAGVAPVAGIEASREKIKTAIERLAG
jgi:3-dehydroquinate synthase